MARHSPSPLPRTFYHRSPEPLARALLGQTLVRILEEGTRLAGRIVETEAYLGEPDRAAHSFGRRRTARNESMYLGPGHAYVYFTYGMHYCMNVVAGEPDEPVACLLRALEPIEGTDRMREHRAVKIPRRRLRATDLCSGPAKLTQALAIDRAQDGADLTRREPIFIEAGQAPPAERIIAAPRVGVAYAGDWATKPLRFYENKNPHVSR